MTYRILLPTVLIVMALVGCIPQAADKAPSEEAQNGTTGPLSQEKITRLFSTTWDANDEATLAYHGNQTSDAESVKNFSWLQCVQLKSSVFFKDAGLKWTTSRSEFLVSLPVNSESFNERIRIIDNFHFAFNDGEHWLVFRARDWEDG